MFGVFCHQYKIADNLRQITTSICEEVFQMTWFLSVNPITVKDGWQFWSTGLLWVNWKSDLGAFFGKLVEIRDEDGPDIKS